MQRIYATTQEQTLSDLPVPSQTDLRSGRPSALARSWIEEQFSVISREGREMTTGKKPASKASKELKSSKSTASEKTVAASDLAQAKSKPKTKKK